jgi:hypothetical protein
MKKQEIMLQMSIYFKNKNDRKSQKGNEFIIQEIFNDENKASFIQKELINKNIFKNEF